MSQVLRDENNSAASSAVSSSDFDYPSATPTSRYFTGDVMYNLCRIFGKEKYYKEQKEKYLQYVHNVFPAITGGEELKNLTCALISLRIRGIQIKRTTDSDSFGCWVIDALHHVKNKEILSKYKAQILYLREQEEEMFKEPEEIMESNAEEKMEYVEYEEDDYSEYMPF